MSYPPPPGLKNTQNPPSLPPRPPPSASHKPFNQNSRSFGANGNKPAPSAFTGFQPRAVATQSSSFRANPSTPSTSGGSTTYSAQPSYSSQSYSNPQEHQSGSYYPQPAGNQMYQQAPQIQNPFPHPSQVGHGGYGTQSYDPEMEAQIAQWQSAYNTKDDFQKRMNNTAASANVSLPGSKADGSGAINEAEINSMNTDSGVASIVTGADGKQKTVVRSGGGQSWQDSSLLEWDPSHFRLFVGNLAGEVTDDSLYKAFSKYPTVQKARVIRDKRTTKSKGYGFVSFSDGDDYFQAAKEMQGKYIGSHPVLLRKSTTEIKATVPRDKHKGGKGGKNNYSGGNRSNAGVHKKQNKTKGGLKILG